MDIIILILLKPYNIKVFCYQSIFFSSATTNDLFKPLEVHVFII